MKLQWESENMAWNYYFYLGWDSFYIGFMLAGVDFQFHAHNLRDVVYEDEI